MPCWLSCPADAFLFTGRARELGLASPFVLSLIGPTIDADRKALGPGADGIVSSAHWSGQANA